jgi:hypothetical protein
MQQRSQCFPSLSPRKTFSNASFRIRLGSVSPDTIFSMMLSESAVRTSSVRGGSLAVNLISIRRPYLPTTAWLVDYRRYSSTVVVSLFGLSLRSRVRQMHYLAPHVNPSRVKSPATKVSGKAIAHYAQLPTSLTEERFAQRAALLAADSNVSARMQRDSKSIRTM